MRPALRDVGGPGGAELTLDAAGLQHWHVGNAAQGGIEGKAASKREVERVAVDVEDHDALKRGAARVWQPPPRCRVGYTSATDA